MYGQYLSLVVLWAYASSGALAQQATAVPDLESKQFHEVSQAEIAVYLPLKRQQDRHLPVNDRVVFFAKRALGQPFRLGGGNLFDNSTADCMSYVERSIAMATAENWQEYAKILQRIISRNGSRDFLERNFFTTTQWIPNNSWLLEDVTDDVAGKYVAYFDAVTWPKQFYSKLRFGQNDTPIGRAKAAAQEAKVRLLPEKAVVTMSYMPIFRAARSTDIQNGDLLLIVREMRKEGLAPWLDIDHMGIAVREPGQGLSIAHCVLAGAKLQTLEDFRAAYPQVVGVKVLRIRPNIQEQIAREIERMPDIEPID